MIHARIVAIASIAVVLSAATLTAQEAPFQYRGHALGSSVAAVVRISGASEADTKRLHERPAVIQELEWRAPYVRSGHEQADPVRDVLFSFYDNQLYQIAVTYDRERIEGMTNDDVITSLSTTYGVPLLRHAPTASSPEPADAATDTIIVARWEHGDSRLTLTRGTYTRQMQLVLIATAIDRRARAAIDEALRLDTEEAPQRELAQREKEAADTQAATRKARETNKAAFRP